MAALRGAVVLVLRGGLLRGRSPSLAPTNPRSTWKVVRVLTGE